MQYHMKIALLGLALSGLVACGGEPSSQGQSQGAEEAEGQLVEKIEGEVFYRERIMLPPGAELEVQLEDISKADAMATVMATVSYTLDGGPPYPFTIEYDPARIDERMRYALRARITTDGELRFTNTEYIDPFSGNPVKVLVHGMARAQPDTADEPAAVEEPVAEPVAEPADSTDGVIVWILGTLEGEKASLGSGGQPIELQMDAAERTASGFSGCNRYSGGFTHEGASTHGTSIKFGPLAGTMMACPDGGDLEQRYLKMLSRVDAYRMERDTLILLSDGDTVATFTPR